MAVKLRQVPLAGTNHHKWQKNEIFLLQFNIVNYLKFNCAMLWFLCALSILVFTQVAIISRILISLVTLSMFVVYLYNSVLINMSCISNYLSSIDYYSVRACG